jgi:hypothetical protein
MNKLSSANDLFDALDGRHVSLGSRTWRIEISGIFEQEGASWVQLTLKGAPPHSVAVKLAPLDTAAEVIGALLLWLKDPSKSSGRVLHFE